MTSKGGEGKGQVNEALRQTLTKEMLAEVEETFRMAADSSGVIPPGRIPTALKALGMSMTETEESKSLESVDLDKFIELILLCMKQPNWAAHEMNEVFTIIDKDCSGNIDPQELKRIFARLGENLLETEVHDQLREFDMNGDYEMAVAEFYKMISSTRGTDFIFEDNIH